MEPLLDAAHARLESVVFENLDWAKVIDRYDGAHSLFYLDPPYFGGENDYGKDLFDRSQFEKMADMLGNIDGGFIMSINDRPEIRELFGQFELTEVALKYSVSKGAATPAAELIVSNREVRPGLF